MFDAPAGALGCDHTRRAVSLAASCRPARRDVLVGDHADGPRALAHRSRPRERAWRLLSVHHGGEELPAKRSDGITPDPRSGAAMPMATVWTLYSTASRALLRPTSKLELTLIIGDSTLGGVRDADTHPVGERRCRSGGTEQDRPTRALAALDEVVLEQLGDSQKVRIGGLVQLTVRLKPAQKARQGRNPATGEQITIAAKPASVDLRVRPLARAKGALPSVQKARRRLAA
jgi:nucleoid DNA-binding protein